MNHRFAKIRQALIAVICAAAVSSLPASAKVIAATAMADSAPPASQGPAKQLFIMGNQARAAQGVRPLEWDAALAQAALAHCERMAATGSISHQYAGEADVDVRAGQAGARFSLIEENVAVGGSAGVVHQAWMNSPHHRENLLSAQVDRVGLAVVSRGGMVYAVADFSKGVVARSTEQVETAVGDLVRATGMLVHDNATAARLACAMDHGMPSMIDDERPEFIMRWQDTELNRLPQQLMARMATGRYKDAAIGSCPAAGDDSTFTSYRVAVLLLKPIGAVRNVSSSR
jgi:uncharacterized protein YkwD